MAEGNGLLNLLERCWLSEPVSKSTILYEFSAVRLLHRGGLYRLISAGPVAIPVAIFKAAWHRFNSRP